jgi:hypothetical protein
VADGPFVAAWLPAGEHRAELVYRAPGLVAGLGLAALAIAGLVLWVLRPSSPHSPTPLSSCRRSS